MTKPMLRRRERSSTKPMGCSSGTSRQRAPGGSGSGQGVGTRAEAFGDSVSSGSPEWAGTDRQTRRGRRVRRGRGPGVARRGVRRRHAFRRAGFASRTGVRASAADIPFRVETPHFPFDPVLTFWFSSSGSPWDSIAGPMDSVTSPGASRRRCVASIRLRCAPPDDLGAGARGQQRAAHLEAAGLARARACLPERAGASGSSMRLRPWATTCSKASRPLLRSMAIAQQRQAPAEERHHVQFFL